MAYILRTMQSSDYPTVLQLWQQSEGLTLRDVDSQPAICAYLARNPGLSFIALDDGLLIGAVLVGTDGLRSQVRAASLDRRRVCSTHLLWDTY